MSYTLEYKQTSNSGTRGFFGYDTTPDSITIHHWGEDGQSHANVVAWLRGANGGTGNTGTSAHHVVSDGLVTQLEKESRATWHAGNSDGNGRSIGIEMRPEMSDGDWNTLVELCADIEERHGSMNYFRHSDWKATECPGRYGDRIQELVEAVNAEHKRRKSGASKPAPKPSKPAKPSKSKNKAAWPYVALKKTDKHTTESHNAWVKLMAAVDYTHDDLGMNLQSWLSNLTDPRTGKGYYDLTVYDHDGVMGPVAVKGLQRKLYDTSAIGKKHLYYGVADGDRGPRTVHAEIDYLNWQRQFVK